MKTVLIILGGPVLAVTTFVGGLVSATAMFTTRSDADHLASTNVSELWTTEPVKINTRAQALQRVAALPASSSTEPVAISAASKLGSIVGANTANPPVFTSGRPESHSSAVGNERPEMAAEHVEWCAEHYRSYRSLDNSYTAFSGDRRKCQSPYATVQGSMYTDQNAQHVSEASGQDGSFGDASAALPTREQEVADLGRPSVSGDVHARSCTTRYRSYRVEDNSYQPVSGGPRRQCQ
jgi:hypothetical protein